MKKTSSQVSRKPQPDVRRANTNQRRPEPVKKPAEAVLQHNGGEQVIPTGPIRIHPDPQHRQMTTEEKTKLKINIGKLTLEQKKGVVPIVQECVSKNGSNPIFEFELDQLSAECLRKLESYVSKQISINQKKDKRKITDKIRREKERQRKE